MKTDFYTKSVLTVIAICLAFNVLKEVDLIPSAFADTPVRQFDPQVRYGLVPLNENGSIDVVITDVEMYAFQFCTVPVKIQD